ncbi:V-type proton ATPase subunit C-like [Aegilops tauschii subsp. strangulata]|uniref:V-type proton ATPase subunit C n=1 Tax=Aegilops tauschii TaxID=37682 RepID=M8BS42_AEGTA
MAHQGKFTVPDLRPGTLDSLLALSDDLVKSNIFIEGVSHKIRRQIEDLERAGRVEPGTLTATASPWTAISPGPSLPVASAAAYIPHLPTSACLSAEDGWLDGCRFVWDEGKYPVNAPLKETVASIQSQVAKIEDLSIMDILFHC